MSIQARQAWFYWFLDLASKDWIVNPTQMRVLAGGRSTKMNDYRSNPLRGDKHGVSNYHIDELVW